MCDPSSDSSIHFISKQLDNIIKLSINPNILMVSNNKNKAPEKSLTEMVEKYNIPFCSMESFGLPMLESYLNKSLACRSTDL
jgi:hypothetical protein